MARRKLLVLLLNVLFATGIAAAQNAALTNAFPNLSFSQPLYLTHSGDQTNRLFVVQQNGIIGVFPNDSSAASAGVFLNISAKLSSPNGEEGLLGLAFPPDFRTSQVFYVNYTAPSPHQMGGIKTVVARYSVVPSDANRADSLSETTLLEVEQPYRNHNGGMLAFGPDSCLYIGLGDGGSGNDPGNNGQTLTTLLGKILRIDVRAGSGYVIPPDNPFAGNTAGIREEIWAYGLRNPWRFSFDEQTGDLWAGDVGQGSREEIDLIVGGGNYGWKIMEGSICRPGGGNCDPTGLISPVADYERTFGNSVTGGYVYRGTRLPQLQGAYLYGDFGSGNLFLLRYEGGQVMADSLLLSTSLSISSFGVDEEHELYVLHYGGTIMKLRGEPVSTLVDGAAVPFMFSLEQNFPNPFNPTTVVSSQLPVASEVKIAVYDLLGREIAVLVDEQRGAGNYQDVFDGSGLASGIYIYRMVAGSFVARRQLILLK